MDEHSPTETAEQSPATSASEPAETEGIPPTEIPDAVKMETRDTSTLEALLVAYDEQAVQIQALKAGLRRNAIENMLIMVMFAIAVYGMRREIARGMQAQAN